MNEDLNLGPLASESRENHDALSEALEELRAMAALRAETGETNRSQPTATAGASCPELADWLRLAYAEPAPGERDALLAHASVCAPCLARLRNCQQLLSPEPSSTDIPELQNFASLTPQWQHRLSVELARTPHQPKRKVTSSIFIWSGLAAAALVVLAVSAAIWWRQQHAPEKLLAEAYSNARTFDLRVPGAGFAPLSSDAHLRGGSTGHESAPLLNARAEIESKLEKKPNDPHWLQLQARAQILEENYDAAIDTLDRLIAAGPVTAGLLTDGGSAYFLRGTATGSENDRATALDYLRRADEMAPSDPVVLFNEALVMEDRGQVMNAVETWDRFLKFERDPKWLEEGRRRLSSLEAKLNRLKTHESRMEQHLATPQSMRALAADPATLAGLDEELTTTLLPKLLDTAFPLPVDRSRGSPCDENCLAARSLLHALASSLEAHHQDPWLSRFLPPNSFLSNDRFTEAARALSGAIDANTRGASSEAENLAVKSSDIFDELGDSAGTDRAEVERIYALQRSYTFSACDEAATALLPQVTSFPWILAQTVSLGAGCNMNSGTAAMNNPAFAKALQIAQTYQYPLLELRARTMIGSQASETGESEAVWRISLETIRRFYRGDYPPFRLANIVSGLAEIEDSTPRTRLDLLLHEESVALFSLSPNQTALSNARAVMIRSAIRAGAMQEANEQLALAQKEGSLGEQEDSQAAQSENEIMMAELYLDRGDLATAARMIESAEKHMTGLDNAFLQSKFALLRGELAVAQGHASDADSLLRAAIVKEEQEAKGTGRENITFARADRSLYAALAGVWLAENRPSLDILALWERYRLRVLGEPVPVCSNDQLDCLAPELDRALQQNLRSDSQDSLIGQIVLRDSVLVYRSDGRNVSFTQFPLQRSELLAAAAFLERVASSPSTSKISVDQAARKLGGILFTSLPAPPSQNGLLLIEPDPILGNVPWAAVETANGPIGLRYNVEESRSILQADHAASQSVRGKPLVVGASAAAGQHELLPEVLQEAHVVASVSPGSTALLANEATEPNVASHLATASVIHFAGHAAQHDGVTRLLLAPTGAPGDKPYLDRSLLLKDPPKAARLIVFSACSTGKREEGWNHGMGDIVDTLASLGVPEVVATRWQIDSVSAVPMMSAFYQGLAGGLRVPQALTAARKSLVRDARYSHPYYWAAYYASGVGNTDLREVFNGKSSKESSENSEGR